MQVVDRLSYILAAPYWPSGPPPNTQTSEGETVKFDCSASGKPTPTITFYKNGVGECFMKYRGIFFIEHFIEHFIIEHFLLITLFT